MLEKEGRFRALPGVEYVLLHLTLANVIFDLEHLSTFADNGSTSIGKKFYYLTETWESYGFDKRL